MSEQKLTDSKGRQWRFAPPQDDGRRLVANDADFAIFEFLDDHGPLPTSYLFPAAEHLRINYKEHQRRLGVLYKRGNTAHGGQYLERPKIQRNSYTALEHELVHDNSDTARLALQNRGVTLNPKRFDHMHHRFMNACCTASVRLSAPLCDLSFITSKTIIARHTCPSSTRDAKNPLAIDTAHGILIPDDLNGLSYPTTPKATFRFLAWEQDRATETLNAIEQKFLCYLDVLRRRSYEGHWGITNLYVLVVTTAPQRMQNMMDRLQELTAREPERRAFFLFKCKREFHEEWIVPPIMGDLLMEPWYRAGLAPLPLASSK